MTPARRAFRTLYLVGSFTWIGIAIVNAGVPFVSLLSLILSGVIFLVGRSAETMER